MPRLLPPVCLLLLVCLLSGCTQLFQPEWGADSPPPLDDDDATDPVSDDDDAAPVPVGVACISPATSFTFPFQEPGQVQLSAEVSWSDGSVTEGEGIAWVLQDGFGGNISPDGVFTMPWNHGGQVTVEAWLDSLVGTCDLDLHMTIGEDLTGGGLLAAAQDALPTAITDPGCAPSLRYPEADSVLPRNWAPLHVQWGAAPGATTYVVRLTGDHVDATWVTADLGLVPAFEAWRALTDVWSTEALTLTVLAGTWDGAAFTGPLCGTDPATLDLSALGLEGQIFYWAASAEGVFRLTLGASAPTVWAEPSTTGWCVGCHTTNLDNPRRMAKVYGGGNGWVVVSDVEQGIADVMPPEARRGNFTTLDPSGRYLVRSFEGTLYLDDLDTNTEIGALPTSGHATHPNWSPDGLSLAYASCDGSPEGYDWVQHNCSLRQLDRVDTDQFGYDSLLVAGGGGVSNYYPSYSPDSSFIAFNRAYDEDTYDAATAELWLMGSDGSNPTSLDAANRGANLGNSWPRWGVAHDDYLWLAFASRRDYGAVTSWLPQVWLAALDPDLMGTGLDPSRPAVWLPGQDTSVGNHTPVWVPRFVEPE